MRCRFVAVAIAALALTSAPAFAAPFCHVHTIEDALLGETARAEAPSGATLESWAAVASRETMGRRLLAVSCTLDARVSRDVLANVRLVRIVAGAPNEETPIEFRLLTGPGVRERNLAPQPSDEGLGFSLLAPISPYARRGFFNRREAKYRLEGGPFTQPVELVNWTDMARAQSSAGVYGTVLQGEKDGLGVAIDGQWVFTSSARVSSLDNLIVAAELHGELASDDAAESFQRSFEGAVSVSRFVQLGRSGAAQIDIKPIAIESDQDGDAIVGRSTIGVTTRVPGTHRLASAIANSIGAGCSQAPDAANCVNSGMFVSFDAGVSYDLRAPDGVELTDTSTWGARMRYQFPLSTNWDITLEASARDDGGDEGQRSNYGVSLRYYLNCPRRAAFTLAYVDGEFSPLGEQIAGLRVGLTTLLGNMGAPRSGNAIECERQ